MDTRAYFAHRQLKANGVRNPLPVRKWYSHYVYFFLVSQFEESLEYYIKTSYLKYGIKELKAIIVKIASSYVAFMSYKQ